MSKKSVTVMPEKLPAEQLTPEEQSYLNEMVARIESAQNELRGALNLICVQKKLQGRWQLSEDNTSLIPVPGPVLVPTPAAPPPA